MIPTLIAIGVVLGALWPGHLKFVGVSILIIAASLAWGVVVGVSDGSVETSVDGSGLALVNGVVGVGIGTAARRGVDHLRLRRRG